MVIIVCMWLQYRIEKLNNIVGAVVDSSLEESDDGEANPFSA